MSDVAHTNGTKQNKVLINFDGLRAERVISDISVEEN
jgi:hypothetical protein